MQLEMDAAMRAGIAASAHRRQREGTRLVALSAVAFSTAGLFTRLVQADAWTLLFWRGLFGGAFILGWIAWTERRGMFGAFGAIGGAGLVAAACSPLATVCFIQALRHTSVAAVTVIFATAPFLAAAIAWVWLRDRPARRTLVASLLALIGVVVMVGHGEAGGACGDLLALAMTGLMALMMVVVHRHRAVSMLPAACLSAFACAVLVAPWAHPASVSPATFGLLVLFGVLQFGLGLLLLTLGSRRLSGPRASLLSSLELPLAPLWVWLAFGEGLTPAGWIGGAIVCAAVVMDAVGGED
ncbi:MAG: DMT family transporter [Rhodospirillales bacterium]|nr:DMT family transporter [Rhodospirillales bacterium]